jgi:hypothetical protein
MKEIIGWIIIGLPFVGVFILGASDLGLIEAVKVFVAVAAIVGVLFVGVFMAFGGV